MGIPSFYRHILRKYSSVTSGNYKTLWFPELIKSSEVLALDSSASNTGKSETQVEILALDFNCIIYAAMKTVAKHFTAEGLTYEQCLRNEVGCWLEKIISTIEPKDSVYISVDGPVPCSKIHQQRLRRFKSQWLVRHENKLRASLGLEEKETSWDRNAITPGTNFMQEMDSYLVNWAKTNSKKLGITIQVSPTTEAGEGEHKIMYWLRNFTQKNVIVYGLDADLILLGMLHSQLTKNRILLVREIGEGTAEDVSLLTFQFFNPLTAAMFLQKELGGQQKSVSLEQWIYDYVTVMSFLGNDFLPHSLGFSIRDGAINHLLSSLEGSCLEANKRLFNIETGEISADVLYCLLKKLEKNEEKNIGHWILNKQKWRSPMLKESQPLQRAMEESEQIPMTINSEYFLLREDGRWLHKDWRRQLETHHFGSSEKHKIAAEDFLQGLSWIRAYYWDSNSVDVSWYYPWSCAPSFEMICRVLLEKGLPTAPLSNGIGHVKPLEQLVMVLPPQSYGLFPQKIRDLITKKASAFTPIDFSLEYFGKRMLWECEPHIPFMDRSIAKSIIEAAKI